MILQLEQIRDLQKEWEVGNWLFALGFGLKNLKMTAKTFLNLEKLESHLSKVSQSNLRALNWALIPAMLALIHPRFLEHPCEGVRLIVASCLSEIIKITSPMLPYNDDIMWKVFQLIEENL